MPRFQAVTILELQYPGGLLMSVMAYPDGAGNTFECWGVNDGTNRGFALVVRKNQAGAETGRWEVEPTADMKADFASIMQTGPHIDVYLANHMPGAQNPEIMKGQKYRLENVAVPYPNGFAPIGAPGAYAPEGGGGGEPMPSVDEIADAVVQRLIVEYGGPLRQVLEDKVKDAIGEGWDPASYPVDNRARKIQDATRPWFRDAAYEATVAYHGPRNPEETALIERINAQNKAAAARMQARIEALEAQED
jgi:hypothetical protein